MMYFVCVASGRMACLLLLRDDVGSEGCTMSDDAGVMMVWWWWFFRSRAVSSATTC